MTLHTYTCEDCGEQFQSSEVLDETIEEILCDSCINVDEDEEDEIGDDDELEIDDDDETDDDNDEEEESEGDE